MSFEPIAIVGQSCILPGALNPDELWEAILAGRDLTSAASDESWRLDKTSILTTPDDHSQDRTWSDRGGYVHGFAERFDLHGFTLPPDEIASLDPLFHWVLHGVREALQSAGHTTPRPTSETPAGLILGNLSYPTVGQVKYAESIWFARQAETGSAALSIADAGEADPRNRFSSGLPAHLAAQALNLGGEAFSLDAACASSLYAIKLACDRLQDRRADLMVAGAVNRTDDLFIHIGFCALQAMSKRGESRPFAADADGLVPAEGAAFVVLKRLADAVSDGDQILGVIRGIGLSNDGSAGGFLSPAVEGQIQAMNAAYEMAGLRPGDISLLECHATGTPVGDTVEIQSAAHIFEKVPNLPLGSLKSNLGHLITVAGVAGLLKVIGALQTKTLPPSRPVPEPLEALTETPFRILQAPEPWLTASDTPRRAAVSAFGFGGNNAHLIVEEWNPATASFSSPDHGVKSTEITAKSRPAIAIVDLEVTAGQFEDAAAFRQALRDGSQSTQIETIDIALNGLRFPPNDLKQTLPQQLLIFALARRLADRHASLPLDTTSVFVGMGCDPGIARYSARWRLSEWAESWREQGLTISSDWIDAAKAALIPGLEAAGVVGTMPNIPANRINAQLNLQGPSYTISAEELSGIRALECAIDALQQGLIDVALVGAVDLSREDVHQHAAARLLDAARQKAGDAAVMLLLKRVEDAERDGDSIVAILDDEQASSASETDETHQLQLGLTQDLPSLTQRFGHAHAASGLLHLAAAAICLQEQMLPPDDDQGQLLPAAPWLASAPRRAQVQIEALGGQMSSVGLRQGTATPTLSHAAAVSFYIYSGANAVEILKALDNGIESNDGPARLVIVAHSEVELSEQKKQAHAALTKRISSDQTEAPVPQQLGQGIVWASAPMTGELSFVFTGAAAAYQGMGRELLLAYPQLGDRVVEKFPCLTRTQAWLTADQQQDTTDPFQILQGCTLLSQVHAVLTQAWLKLKPQAVLGVSSGETNAVFATGAWHDMAAMFAEMDRQGMYTREIAGEYQTAQRAWQERGINQIDWVGWRVLAPVAEVETALEGEEFATLTMINSPVDCLIAGQADACRRVVEKIGIQRAVENRNEIIAHHPVMKSWEGPWYEIHSRETRPVPDIRFYSNASGSHYAPTRETVAAALTDQATSGVDFRRVVNAAWEDGVRIFVEHGPRNVCSGWIRAILDERPHLVVSLDRPNGLAQTLEAVAHLIAAGVEVDYDTLTTAAASQDSDTTQRSLSLAAHYPPVKFPPLEVQPATADHFQLMESAPPLPPVLADYPQDGNRPLPILPAQHPDLAAEHATPAASPPPAQMPTQAIPKPPETTPNPMIEQLTQFHSQVSAAHQMFLAQQERAMKLLLKLQQGQSLSDVPPADEQTQPMSPQPAAVNPLQATPTPPKPNDPHPVPAPPTKVSPSKGLPGPKLNRAQLEHLASGKISEVLGSIFARQDGYERQVRMPMPPLLLADRVLGIEAESGAYGQKGTIWTETDVTEDAWYLHNGRMPAGIMIESGQADLLLISYLGSDFLNQGQRVYRLLGCEATFHGALPAVGDTLRFEIHVDGYAQQGDVRLFFFHYDCTVNGQVVLSVRHGQAGFFTDEELANSAGVIWDPNEVELKPNPRLDPPAVPVTRAAFSAEQVTAFSEGRIADCFGGLFWRTQTQVRPPAIARGRMLLFDEVIDFDPTGGPWRHGYIRAEDHLAVDEWFFEGHFKNDPCMPGTLMLEGALQVMAFYLTALGYTLDHDGWRFEPVPEEIYTLRARGQVTPGAQKVTYEIFVEEVIADPTPTLYADLLCTVDGLAAFHCRRMGLRLVPSYPLESRLSLLASPELVDPDPARSARTPDHIYDPRSIAACAWGQPSHAFGSLYARFDGPEHCPRLPGPPYLFMTRLIKLDADKANPVGGGTLEAEYQIPSDAWYFAENGNRTMPYAVLLEAALQPCGWFASYKGVALQSDIPLYFRNLDGTATQLREVVPTDGLLRTRVTSTNLSRLGSMTIVGFEVVCTVDNAPVFEMTTSFGFFPKEALADQAGLPVSEADQGRLAEPSTFRRELSARPPRYFHRSPALAGPMLHLLSRVSGFWPEGGPHGLGRIRAEIDVDPQAWFFKCHFMGDPVQPGSLGIEAMIQTLQFYMLEMDMAAGIKRPRFEPIQLGEAMTWKYRGQVLPSAQQVTIELEITERGEAYAIANASYWVDGLRIYKATGLGMRIVSDETGRHTSGDERLDPAIDLWLQDHRPTWTVPAMAMMSMVDRLAAGALIRAPGRKVTGLRNIRVHRWLGFASDQQQLKVIGSPLSNHSLAMELLLWDEEQQRYATVASGDILVDESWSLAGAAWPPLVGATQMPNPYATGELFHGPAYQMMTDLWISAQGATYWLDLEAGAVPPGALNQGLLDAATHGIPHDALWRWSSEIPADGAAYPIAITQARFFGPPPGTGRIRCEARFSGFRDGKPQFPIIHIQIVIPGESRDTVWAEIELVETILPKGPIGKVDPAIRRAFLQDRVYRPEIRLSHERDGQTYLADQVVQESDWLRGTIATAYGVSQGDDSLSESLTYPQWLTRQVAVREHIAHRFQVHPANLLVTETKIPDTASVAAANRPLNRYTVTAQRTRDGWQVSDVEPPGTLAVSPVRDFWRNRLQTRPSLVEDLTLALIQRFVHSVEIVNPAAFTNLKGQGVLYLANHQLDLESMLFASLMTGLQETLTTVIARQELNESWVGPYFEQCFQHPHMPDLGMLLLIDRASPQAVLADLTAALDRIRDNQSSLLIHVEGKHALQARQPVEVISASLIDLAVARDIPIVPVRFVGGLPVQAADVPLAFPVNFGKQTVWIGAPILPATLAAQPSAARKEIVLAAINGFDDRWRHEEPAIDDAGFAATVNQWQAARNVSETQGILYHTLAAYGQPSAETQWLLAALGQHSTASIPALDQATRQWLRTFSLEILGLTIESEKAG